MYRLAALYFLIPEGERSAADCSATRTGRKRSSLHRARRFRCRRRANTSWWSTSRSPRRSASNAADAARSCRRGDRI